VDPTSEDALDGLSSAVTNGDGLTGASLEYPPSMTGHAVPVLASTRVPVGLSMSARVSLLPSAAVATVRSGVTLLAIGWRRRDIARPITREGTLIGLYGALPGSVVGVAALTALSGQVPPQLVAAGAATAILSTMACALPPKDPHEDGQNKSGPRSRPPQHRGAGRP